jgi:trk system potassium uptake protein
MRIVIVGAGEVGYHVARRLSEEQQDVVLIEADPDRAEFVGNQLDVLTITGNGASLAVLEQAGLAQAGMMLAVTSRDEVNVLCCLAASRFDVGVRVARVGNPQYYQPGSALSREHLGIDVMINPERECAWDTFQLLNSEAATDLARFADGRLQMMGLRVRPGASIAGRTVLDIDALLRDRHYTMVAVVRGDEVHIPRGSTRIETGDEIFVLAPPADLLEIPALAGYAGYKLRRVMIAGGSEEAVYLAQHLEEHHVECTILDTSRRRCLELAEQLPRALILHGDATNLELLEMEGVEGIDGFVAYTGHDEVNMLTSLLAKTSGARKVISLINRFEYLRIVPKFGIDAAVSARQSTVNAILTHVRRGNVLSVATVRGSGAEALELTVPAGSPATAGAVAELRLPRDVVVGAILRGDRIMMARGRDHIEAGDRVVVFALPSALHEMERYFG